MNVLIIGSEGFIGNHCVRYFIRKGYNVTGSDLQNAPSLPYAYIKTSRLTPELSLHQKEFDFCIYAGGNGSVPISFSDPVLDFEANVLDIVKLLEEIKKSDPGCRFLNISSAAVYGNPSRLPVAESDPVLPLSPYGWHKYMSEIACKEYFTLHGVRTCSMRPFSVYGPGLRKQIVWDIYQRTLTQPDEITLSGTGKETRDFIFIDDFVQAVDLVLHKAAFEGEALNVASGVETSISDLATLLLKNLDYKGRLMFSNASRQGDPLNWKADIEKLAGLGMSAPTPLTEGILKTAAWLSTLPKTS